MGGTYKMNNVSAQQPPPFAPGVYTFCENGEASPALLGGKCPKCAIYLFPKPRYCPKCLRQTEQSIVGRRGTLYSLAVVRTRPPLGLPQPYAVGYVDMAETGLRIFCLLDPYKIDAFQIGSKVNLALAQLGHDRQGNPCLRPYFTLNEGSLKEEDKK
jgi:uncharacterized OB-fold protein